MKHLSILTITALASLSSTTLLAEEKPLKSKLVKISVDSYHSEEDDATQRLFRNGLHPAIRLTFMVKSKNIVQIYGQSVATKSKDWKCRHNYRITEEGKAAAFTIEKKGASLEKVDGIQVQGTIDIQTGTKLVSKTFSLLSYDEPLRIDNFIFTLLENKLKVDGNHEIITEIIVEQNSTILDSNKSRSSGDSKTYDYPGIDKGAKITFSYWDGLVTHTVQFLKK